MRLQHLTTATMARDLDRIRAALGEQKASFYGASYGSALGAAYVSLFPDTTDRIVVDSNLADSHLDRDGLRRFARGVEETFPDFAYLTFAHLYGDIQYGNLARIWQTLLSPGAAPATPATPAAQAASPVDNALTVFLPVTCNDVNWPEDLANYRRGFAEDRMRYPIFGAATANITPCAVGGKLPAQDIACPR